WQIAQLPAIACTPLGVRLGAANAGAGGAGCCASAPAAARPAIATAAVRMRLALMRDLLCLGEGAYRAPCAKQNARTSGRFGLACGRLRRFHRLGGLRGRLRDVEPHLASVVDVDRDAAAVGELAEEQLVGERAADRV